MGVANARKSGFPIYPAVLKWAREEWGLFTLEEAAAKAGTSARSVAQWEAGTAVPTEKQGRLLADLYGRHFMEFTSSKVPDEVPFDLVPDFRLDPRVFEGDRRAEKRALRRLQFWAESCSLNTLDLYEMIEEPPLQFPGDLRARLEDCPEKFAAAARELAGFSLDDHFQLPEDRKSGLVNTLRDRIEGIGVIVLKSAELDDTRARGFCLSFDTLPVIAFRGESPGDELFTISHELGHVLLGETGISDPYIPRVSGGMPAEIEQWCNWFAGAFLMPSDAVHGNVPTWKEAASISDDDLNAAAANFGVSAHAMLLRLIQLGLVDEEFYWKVKRDEILNADPDRTPYSKCERDSYWHRSRNGDLYTCLVLEAVALDEICWHDAGRFLETGDTFALWKMPETFRA